MADNKNEIFIRSSAAEYLTFVASTGDSDESIEMRYEDENIWLTQKMMAALYDVGLSTINEHIKKIYADNELTEEATIRKFRIVQTENKRQVERDTKHYNLQMERIVSAYLDMAEDMANRHIPMTMEDWEKRLNGFLKMWDREVLNDAGKVSAELAKQHALSEFEKYRVVQDRLYESDFDRFIEEVEKDDQT